MNTRLNIQRSISHILFVSLRIRWTQFFQPKKIIDGLGMIEISFNV